jgi:tetratricopeptide (TPR) repeat protein
MRKLLLIATLAAGAVAPLAGQSADDEIRAGQAARDSLNAEAALQHFERAARLDSANYEANWRTALALIDVGAETPDSIKSPARDSMYALAETYARRAVTLRPDDADGHFVLADAIGRASLTKGKKERVERAKEIRDEALEAIRLNPRHDGAYHILGRWNAEIMRLSGVQRFVAKNFLGGAVFNQASWNGAVANLERAVELDPQRIFHRLDLALVYLDLKRYPEARTQLQRIAALPAADPRDPRYHHDAARILAAIATDHESQ